MSWHDAKVFLAEHPALLCERILAAKETQTVGPLHDPIEDDPALATQFSDAKTVADAAFQSWLTARNAEYRRQGLDHLVTDHPLGSCHFVWREMKKILREKHGIEWFTPVEMNPGTTFD